jgi:DNA-binding GntR family transcriptional regulator
VLAPLPRVSLADRAYETLLDAIVTGSLAPGARIRDGELAEQLETSRMPVREALKRLEAEGLVETVPNRETRVAPIRAERAAQAFPVIAALHALGTRLGVPALTAADDDRMRSLDRERARALKRGDVITAIELDDAFHGVLLEAAGNQELTRALERLMPQVRRLDALHFTELTRHDSAADHAEILDACRRRDAHEAARLVEANFLRLGAQMAAILGASARRRSRLGDA